MRIGCVRPKGRRLTGVRKGGKPLFAILLGLVVLFLPFLFLTSALAAEVGSFSLPSLRLGIASADSPTDVALSLQILGLLTVLSLAPAILLMITSFTRIVIVLGFVQRAIGLQQSPPQQVVTGLALFLTLFTMYPTWNQVYENGLAPYLARDISAEQAWQRTVVPVREFLFRYTRQEELSLMTSMAKRSLRPFIPSPNRSGSRRMHGTS